MPRPRRRKGRRVPEVLWRVFRGRAQPLLDAVASSLLPPAASAPEEKCRWCRGSLCLGCAASRGEDVVKSFLLRPEDPGEYRKLMTRCFVVVHEEAALPWSRFSTLIIRSQRQIVMRIVETMVAERPRTNNVLCNDYKLNDKWSASFDILSTPAWCLLLERIGTSLMSYLLKGSSIFLPLPGKKHYQVAGPPAAISKYSLSKLKRTYQSSDTSVQSGVQKKIKISGDVNFSSARFKCDNSVHGNNLKTCCKSTDWCSICEVHQVGSSNQRVAQSITNRSTFTTQEPQVVQGRVANPITENIGKQLKTLKQNRKRKQRRINSGPACSSQILDVVEGCSNGNSQEPLLCPCCLMVKSARRLPKGVHVQKKRMFYNLESPLAVLPRKHSLISLKPDASSSILLSKEIFELPNLYLSPDFSTCSHYNGSCPMRELCLYHSLIKLLRSLIKRTRSCQYLRLLDKHCIVPSSVEGIWKMSGLLGTQDDSGKPSRQINGSKQLTNDVKTVDQEMEKVQLCSSKSQVVSFIWAVCRNIVPKELIGSCRNQRILRRNIYKFIQLRRFEKFSLKQCMHKLKLNEFPFLSSHDIAPSCMNQFWPPSGMLGDLGTSGISNGLSRHISDIRHILLDRWIYWFFSSLVAPLVQTHFYVTESEHGRQDILYYRKSIWERLCHGEMSRKIIRRFNSVNSVLHETHAVLKNVKLKEPEKLGSSVFDYHDIYRRLSPFLFDLKNGTGMPEIYLIVSDVSKAFDSIGQDKLLNVMQEVITEPRYHLEKFREIICQGKPLWVQDNTVSVENKKASIPTRLVCCNRSSHGVFIKQERGKIISRDELFSNLIELVKRNVVQFDKSFYLQVVGIPQGSVLSTLLCSFYFAHLERNLIFPFLRKAQVPVTSEMPLNDTYQHFSRSDIRAIREHYNVLTPKCILLRFVDDFLFISTSKSQATNFFSRLKRGFRDYNCFMKEEKFRLNFDVGATTRTQSSTVHVGDEEFIQWSGMLINCRSLEFQADYTRYLNNHLRSTLCVLWQGKPSSHLKKKLCAYLRPKCFPIFFDPKINSGAIIRLNIYQNFLLCAMKFHCYITELSYICKIPAGSQLHMIENSFGYMLMLLKRMQFMDGYSLPKLVPGLEREVEWLGLVAYIQALERKQTRHRPLLSLLKSRFFKHRVSGEISPALAYAVDRSHSSVLWRIRY
ncbi:hypothetical protein MLD38_003219 [Melastoma candidum]|uniref:Uncharacterized protein n=1 Tax=Melastoma candidum TaxID=119954 RepID=A0ACB9S512_9MYRT|nr:hypothetical protein MLD38_003219 [Melastoma candidum]